MLNNTYIACCGSVLEELSVHLCPQSHIWINVKDEKLGNLGEVDSPEKLDAKIAAMFYDDRKWTPCSTKLESMISELLKKEVATVIKPLKKQVAC